MEYKPSLGDGFDKM